MTGSEGGTVAASTLIGELPEPAATIVQDGWYRRGRASF
jgi:hypothetical protein